jgi:hypothetical protein
MTEKTKHMKNIDTIPEEEALPTEHGRTRRVRPRRMPPPPDELLPASRRSAAVPDIRERLERLRRSGRFSQPVDLKLLATTWATDYVSLVFPQVEGDERTRLLFAAEAGFLASTELSKCGIRHWERLLQEARKTRDEYSA